MGGVDVGLCCGWWYGGFGGVGCYVCVGYFWCMDYDYLLVEFVCE